MIVMKNLQKLEKKVENRIKEDEFLSLIGSIADKHKVQLYVIGGYVRDILLGIETQDTDFAVLKGKSAFYKELEKQLHHHVITFRKKGIINRRILAGERVFDFVDASKKGLNNEISRRDFTINSISYFLNKKKLSDPQNGIQDLKRKIIRRNKKSVFRSDPLRMMRAIRLICEKDGFTIDEETLHQIKSSPENINKVSKERVKEELDKVLLTSRGSKGISILYETGILKHLIPEITPLEDFAQGSRHRYDALQHTLKALFHADDFPKICKQLGLKYSLTDNQVLLLKYSLLFHDIAKPQTFSKDESGNVHFYHHERVSSLVASRIMKRLKFSKRFIHDVKVLIELHLRPHLLAETKVTDKALLRLVRESAEMTEIMALHALADALATEGKSTSPKITRLKKLLKKLLEKYDDMKIQISAPAKLISGDDVMNILGYTQGPQVGKVLKKIEDLHLSGAISSREEALKYIRKLS
jgi:tRNA nucleotidyltransferase/poly(A) polymerase